MEYDVVIGLEVHTQLITQTKMFCSCLNKYGSEPNTNVCPVCMGYPGAMPVMNREAVKKSIMAGLSCGCDIAEYAKFDRKNYYYPDMPKNYQITQYDLPFCLGGEVPISGKGFSGEELETRNIKITRMHLEEDVAKLTHMGYESAVDYNRAGTPLLEIVSEPDMFSADEAYAYLNTLKQILQYAGVGHCDMEKGQMRCDVNISVKPKGQVELGEKIELKNLNSFRAVHRAIEFEIERQIECVEDGIALSQETRGWNDEVGETYFMRSKENAHDYRYFPEPDLMPVTLDREWVKSVKDAMPEGPLERKVRFVESFGITEYDAQVLTTEKDMADFYDKAASASKNPKLVANWMMTELMRELSNNSISLEECKIAPEQLAQLINLIEKGDISGKIAKKVFAEMFSEGKDPEVVVKEKGLVQVSDSGQIDEFAQQAIDANPKAVEEYLSGKGNAIQFLMGQVMKMSKGQANPKMAIQVLRKKLDK